jgi:hypothetical protein
VAILSAESGSEKGTKKPGQKGRAEEGGNEMPINL